MAVLAEARSWLMEDLFQATSHQGASFIMDEMNWASLCFTAVLKSLSSAIELPFLGQGLDTYLLTSIVPHYCRLLLNTA
jgi:hypothetical protein